MGTTGGALKRFPELDEQQLDFERFLEAFDLFSEMGYGRKTTIGKGRFTYDPDAIETITIDASAASFMALSPFVPKGVDEAATVYYEPFTRFGKFGGDRVHKNPFKKPVLMADAAGAILYDKPVSIAYVGQAIHGLTEISEYDDTVHQGYAIVVPTGVDHAKI